MKKQLQSGFSMLELIIVLSIMAFICLIVFSSFGNFRKNQALRIDTETIVEVSRQARNQTLASKNSNSYGVHFGTSKITLFLGTTYAANAPGNQDFSLSSTDTILTVTLTGGGSDVVFDRLTGATSKDGSIVISSPGISETKTVTIYKTGLVESN